ncbi:EamA family transporter [Pontibacillus litoralis]|uniref:EamA domain-containing protein n=1 Tax=Pontibacillus litoralis JSM 072002 TaxID=1385512 RepID=A0A0A5G0L3_9BACI|nr:EamA family transporter [Pontibacillus litoralis]KGX85569.1 hypothetical protein N784_08655 [Pontibacillus litoralis JSM 072002]
METDRKKLKYIFAVLIGSCSYGLLSTIVKLAYAEGISPAVATVGQFFVGWVILFVLLLLAKQVNRISIKEKVTLMVAGVPTGLVGVFYYQSLVTIDASIAIILLFQFVWIGIVLDSVIHKRLPERVTVFSIAILFLGTALGSGGSWEQLMTSLDWRGFIFGILAAICFSLFIMSNAKVSTQLSPVQRSFYMVSGSLVTVVLIFIPQLVSIELNSFVALGWKGILLGFFGVFIPPFLFAYGMPNIGSTLGSILGSAELPVAVLSSMLVLQESVSWLQWIGVLLILVAIVIPNVKRRHSKKVQYKEA